MSRYLSLTLCYAPLQSGCMLDATCAEHTCAVTPQALVTTPLAKATPTCTRVPTAHSRCPLPHHLLLRKDTALHPADVARCHARLQAGWNKLDCTSCGTNFDTDTSATNGLGLTADQCFIEAGWGSSKDSTGKLVAKLCQNGHYGASDRIYGNSSHPCLVRLVLRVACAFQGQP